MTLGSTSAAEHLQQALAELPMMDAHTHLVGGRLGARGLHDILLYHMVVSDLYAAGCPSGSRLTQYPGRPSQAEARARIEEALPYLPLIRNTSGAWAIRTILADLYDWHDPITTENWRRLDGMIRERADDRAWHHAILDRLHVARTCAEYARRGDGADDERLQYSLEWGFFTRCQWGEFDTALYGMVTEYDENGEYGRALSAYEEAIAASPRSMSPRSRATNRSVRKVSSDSPSANLR